MHVNIFSLKHLMRKFRFHFLFTKKCHDEKYLSMYLYIYIYIFITQNTHSISSVKHPCEKRIKSKWKKKKEKAIERWFFQGSRAVSCVRLSFWEECRISVTVKVKIGSRTWELRHSSGEDSGVFTHPSHCGLRLWPHNELDEKYFSSLMKNFSIAQWAKNARNVVKNEKKNLSTSEIS